MFVVSLPFLLVAFNYFGRCLFAIACRTRLEINSRTFRLEHRCLGFRREVAKGNPTDIDSVKVVRVKSLFQSKGEEPRFRCSLTEGTNEHTFGITLTTVEKEWLVAEIAHFLKLPHDTQRRLAG